MNNQNFTDILNQSLGQLREGASLEEILSAYPAATREELRPLLETAQSVLVLPKKQVLEPAMQRKYVLAPARKLWFAWIHFSKFATVSVSLVLLATFVAGTGYAAINSLPGTKLFTVKKTAEHLQLKLASSPESKANLQVEIAKERLSQAQTILNNPESKANQKEAAVNELLAQTKNSIQAVSDATKTNPLNGQSQPIVASLDEITKQQQTLLNKVETNSAKDALVIAQANINQVKEIKKYIEAAANEQTAATLAANPDSVTTLGMISKKTENAISVNDIDFILIPETSIQDANSAPQIADRLKVGAKVNVIGKKLDDKKNQALQIIILADERIEATVKGTSTPQQLPIQKPSSTPETINESQPDPNTATASFILEDSAPQAALGNE